MSDDTPFLLSVELQTLAGALRTIAPLVASHVENLEKRARELETEIVLLRETPTTQTAADTDRTVRIMERLFQAFTLLQGNAPVVTLHRDADGWVAGAYGNAFAADEGYGATAQEAVIRCLAGAVKASAALNLEHNPPVVPGELQLLATPDTKGFDS